MLPAFPPYSEAFGRKKLYILSTALYAAFSVVVAAVPSIIAVVIGRFATGLLSGIPTSVVAGSIEDMYSTDDRIWLIFAWAVAANIGIIVGPIIGTYVTHSLGWYVLAIQTSFPHSGNTNQLTGDGSSTLLLSSLEPWPVFSSSYANLGQLSCSKRR
jgi:MFS family permease